MKRSIFIIAGTILVVTTASTAVLVLHKHKEFTRLITTDEIVDQVMSERMRALETGEIADLGDKDEINILLLGLDSRKGADEVHCDAIHMFTLDLKDETLTITSVPRGTIVYIPGGPFKENEYYLANACAFAGIDYGIEQIEQITGKYADFVVTVGFSQVLGILRTLNLPTTETLQWLRHRHSYAVGEPQRTHNQAVFIKDMILTQLDRFENDLALPIQYILYRLVDTDMDFGTARALIQYVISIDLDERPENIILKMRPYWETVDIHFDIENPEEQLKRIEQYIQPLLSEADFSGRSSEDVQAELIDYLEYRLYASEPIDDVLEQMLWLQIEDRGLREFYHFKFIERFSAENYLIDPDLVIETLSDYVFEMETLGLSEYEEKGTELLAEYLESESAFAM